MIIESMKNRTIRFLRSSMASTLTASLIIAAPGLPCYQALAGTQVKANTSGSSISPTPVSGMSAPLGSIASVTQAGLPMAPGENAKQPHLFEGLTSQPLGSIENQRTPRLDSAQHDPGMRIDSGRGETIGESAARADKNPISRKMTEDGPHPFKDVSILATDRNPPMGPYSPFFDAAGPRQSQEKGEVLGWKGDRGSSGLLSETALRVVRVPEAASAQIPNDVSKDPRTKDYAKSIIRRVMAALALVGLMFMAGCTRLVEISDWNNDPPVNIIVPSPTDSLVEISDWNNDPPYLQALPYQALKQEREIPLNFPEQASVKEAQTRAAKYLLQSQRENGAWGINKVTKLGNDNSHLHVGVTAVAIRALETTRPDGYSAAIERGFSSLFNNLRNEPNYLFYNNSHPYAVSFALSLLTEQLPRSSGKDRERYEEAVRKLVRVAQESPTYYSWEESVGIGPRERIYYPAATFQMALLADALLNAKGMVNEEDYTQNYLDGLLGELEGSRLAHGGYSYYLGRWGESQGLIEDELSTIARDPLIELVLYRAGRSDLDKLRRAIHSFVEHRKELEEVLGTDAIAHAGKHHFAKYYYLFGMYWTAQALGELPSADAPLLAREMIQDLLRLQLPDGAWEDSPEITGRSYGAAMGILTLQKLSSIAARPEQASFATGK